MHIENEIAIWLDCKRDNSLAPFEAIDQRNGASSDFLRLAEFRGWWSGG